MSDRYKCGCCNCLEPENAALAQGSTATITVADTPLNNKCAYCLRYCVKFSGATGAEVLQVTVGASTYPVWDKDGEPLKIGRLRRGELLTLRYISTAPAHFTLKNCAHTMCLKTPETAEA